MACANIGGRFYGIQGACPRCAFDLWKGTIVTDEAFGSDIPRVACPTCSTTFSLTTGKHGSPRKRSGLAGFVGGLALTATVQDSAKDAKVYTIATEQDRIFCRERV
jgi:nitrite reductase/ring-hydroxylating ferredoxin subunit